MILVKRKKKIDQNTQRINERDKMKYRNYIFFSIYIEKSVSFLPFLSYLLLLFPKNKIKITERHDQENVFHSINLCHL